MHVRRVGLGGKSRYRTGKVQRKRLYQVGIEKWVWTRRGREIRVEE